jgi:hypothetical protein
MVIFLVTLVLVAHDHKIVHQLDHLRLYSRLLFVKCGCVCVWKWKWKWLFCAIGFDYALFLSRNSFGSRVNSSLQRSCRCVRWFAVFYTYTATKTVLKSEEKKIAVRTLISIYLNYIKISAFFIINSIKQI